MRISTLLLSVVFTLGLVFLFLDAPNLGINYWTRATATREAPQEERESPPPDTESSVTEWPGSVGLRKPQSWTRVRTCVVCAGDLKQRPREPEIECCTLPGSPGPQSHSGGWTRVRTGIAPGDLQQRPHGSENTASEQHRLLAWLWDYLAQLDENWLPYTATQILLLLCEAWLALRRWRNASSAAMPQGQRSNRDASHRTGPGCGEQGNARAARPRPARLPELSRRKPRAAGLSSGPTSPHTVHCAPGLSRCQRSGQTASASVGTDGWRKGTVSQRSVLWLPTNVVRCLRTIHRLHLMELRRQHLKRAASVRRSAEESSSEQEERRGAEDEEEEESRASSSSPYSSSSSMCPGQWQCDGQWC